MKDVFPRITIDDGIQFGKPVIKGTRVPVETIIGHVSAGDAIEDIMKQYSLTREDVFATLKYAAKIVAEEIVLAR